MVANAGFEPASLGYEPSKETSPPIRIMYRDPAAANGKFNEKTENTFSNGTS